MIRARLLRAVSVLLVLCALEAVAAPEVVPSGPATPATPTERLVRLAEVWARARVVHPWLNACGLDWDAAWVKAAPLARDASTPEAFRAAVGTMLATLGDSATRVVSRTPAASSTDAPTLSWRRTVAVLTLAASDAPNDPAALGGLDAQLAKATGVVVDLRGASPGATRAFFQTLTSLHPEKPVPVVERFVGWSNPSAPNFTEWSWELPEPRKRSGLRVALVLGRDDSIGAAQALVASGEPVVVATEALSAACIVTTVRVPLDQDFEVDLRVGEVISHPELDAFQADLLAPAGKDAVTVAVEALARAAPRRKKSPPLFGIGARPEVPDTGPAYPTRERRLLAGVKLWLVMSNFWGYHAQHEALLKGVLADVLPRLEAARDAKEYGQAMLEFTARFPDAHTSVWGPAVTEVRGRASLGVSVVPMTAASSNVSFVVDAVSPTAAQAGFAVGDIVEGIDGLPVAERVRVLETQTSSAHAEGRRWLIAQRLFVGQPGAGKASLRGAGGVREVAFTRTVEERWWNATPKEHFRVLPGNVGYVHLPSLTQAEVPVMLEQLQHTRGIIFDDRGYPQGTGFVIGPCLDRLSPSAVAQFFHPVAAGDVDRVEWFAQRLPPCSGARYTGATVMLIDGRALSQAEHTGLIFEAYAGTTFVGSPTQGTNGDVATWPLPGGLTLQFTQLEVRHADFRPLQNVGLTPQVTVRPTLAGVRAGRDEVLEAAAAWMEKNAPR